MAAPKQEIGASCSSLLFTKHPKARYSDKGEQRTLSILQEMYGRIIKPSLSTSVYAARTTYEVSNN